PLKDRFGSQIRTHYPRTIAHEIEIMEQERTTFSADGLETAVPGFIKEIVAEVTHLARRSNDISQRSGVSVRVSITNYENLLSAALKRSVRLGERHVAPRVSDLPAIAASTLGKIEMETVGDVNEEKIIDRLTQGAVLAVFNRHFNTAQFQDLLTRFDQGLAVEAGDDLPAMEYVRKLADVPSLKAAVAKLGAQGNPATVAAAVEFVLEGLHLNRKLNKDRVAGHTRYRR
ncbi:MAG: magnesium chelatase, partial [Chloroflexi bacterium]|nr:magnesium chelatase [Chloroflexota bacterium]